MPGTQARRSRHLPAAALLASLALLADLIAAPVATAAPRTWYVGAHASGGGSCASPDAISIQAAVDMAQSGDTVHVCAGMYFLDAEVSVPKHLLFEGDGAATTILDGKSRHRIFNAIPCR